MDAESAAVHAMREAIRDAGNYLTEDELRDAIEDALVSVWGDDE